MQEVWKDIPDYEGLYQVSNFGRVKRLKGRVRYGNGFRTVREKIIGGNKKYRQCGLSKNNIRTHYFSHVLVAMIFMGYTKTKGMVVDHIDNNPRNNHISNLQIITSRENSSKDRKNKSSKYTGVCWNNSRKKWKAQIYHTKKIHVLGFFIKEYDAHLAYQKELSKAVEL